MVKMIVYFMLVILLCLVIFHFSTRKSRAGILYNKLPGYFPYPLVGNLLKFHQPDPHKLWQVTREMTEKFYPITRVWFVRSAVVSIRHPDDAQILLSSQRAIDKGYFYDYLHPWLKTGLLTSTGEKWRQRRKILTSAFHFNILRQYLEIMNDEGEKCVFDLTKEGNEIQKNLVPFSSEITLNIICKSAMGVTWDKIRKTMTHKYKKAIHELGYVVVYRISRPQIFDWVMKLPWKLANMQRNALKVLHGFTNMVVNDRREYHKITQNKYLNQTDEDNEVIGRKQRLAMLDHLLAAEKNGLIDDDGIKEEVDTFTFEGHDTTGMALAFTLLLLAENKHAQDLVRAELSRIIGEDNRKIEMVDLQELTYLDRCIKESLRLYPPVATIFRYTAEDIQLKHGLIPGGSDFIIHIYDCHRDPNFWTEPDKFDPDRFLPENCKNRHPYAYIPFSAGPRNCIGQKFAMMELKTTIAYILNNFYLEPVDNSINLKLIADIVIRPVDPIRIKFLKIKKS